MEHTEISVQAVKMTLGTEVVALTDDRRSNSKTRRAERNMTRIRIGTKLGREVTVYEFYP